MLNQSEELDFLCDMPVPFSVFRVLLDENDQPFDAACVYVNDAGARVDGFSRDELVGRTLRDLAPFVDEGMLSVIDETARCGAKQYFTRRISGDRYLSIQMYQPKAGYCAFVMHDVTDRAHQEAVHREECRRLEHQATRDPLTGLYNVRQGRKLVEEELGSPRWKDARGALFMFDLDDFKLVNDEFGHDRGDAVLKGFARVLERSFRRSDVVFRAGGDEFSAFVPDIPCACVVERICADVIAGVEALADACVEVSVSIGVAIGRSTHSYESFYRASDQALYGIKRMEKSSYRITDMDDVKASDVQGPAAPEGGATTLPAA